MRLYGDPPEPHVHLSVHPHDFFKIDSVVGWKVNKGRFTISIYDTTKLFLSTVNSAGNRITSDSDTTGTLKRGPRIDIYGCSYTFGFSVADSCTSSYKLQQMLPDVQVINKGVPGYGLAQMFLLLKQSIAEGDTPTIAVFNYGALHDVRTPLNKDWISFFGYTITEGYSSVFKKMRYPYMEYRNDSLQLAYSPFDKWTKDWPFRKRSYLINYLNTFYFYYFFDSRSKDYLHLISRKTAFEIMNYCKLNHITPIFANVFPDQGKDILDSLAAKGFYTLNYGIKVYDDDMPNKYNCGTIDPDHPNCLAHSIYAQKLYDLIRTKKLLSADQ